jgi:hypothetical protein
VDVGIGRAGDGSGETGWAGDDGGDVSEYDGGFGGEFERAGDAGGDGGDMSDDDDGSAGEFKRAGDGDGGGSGGGVESTGRPARA